MALPKSNSTRTIDWNALNLTSAPVSVPSRQLPGAAPAPYTPPPAGNMQTPGPVQQQPQAGPGFSEAIQAMMKEYQGLGTKPFVEKGIKAQEAQNARVMAPSDLIGAAPGVQSAARSASAAALNPTISGADKSAQTFSEQIGSFKGAIDSARSFMQQREENSRAEREEARSNLLLALQLGGAEGLEAIDKEMPDIFKIAGFDKETLIATAKKKQAADRAFEYYKASPKGTSKEDEKAAAKQELLGLLNQYRTELADSNAFSRLFGPNKAAALQNLKGQITAVYKKEQQLGTLDAGVQKLIDSIIPGTSIMDVSQLSTQAQLDAIDNFIANQGGTAGGDTIRVRVKATGETGSLPADEFDPKIYDKI